MLRRVDGSIRYFSIRESARLQTFPEDGVIIDDQRRTPNPEAILASH